jgi:Na+-driven multidrug efflux pump
VWITGLWNMAFMTVITVVFVLYAEGIVGVFTEDPETLSVGTAALRIISYGYVFYAWGMVVLQAFNGAGDTLTPTWVNFVAFWLIQIPLAWWLATRTALGHHGVYAAIAIAYSLSAVFGMILFRRGRWKLKQV